MQESASFHPTTAAPPLRSDDWIYRAVIVTLGRHRVPGGLRHLTAGYNSRVAAVHSVGHTAGFDRAWLGGGRGTRRPIGAVAREIDRSTRARIQSELD